MAANVSQQMRRLGREAALGIIPPALEEFLEDTESSKA